MIVSLGDARTTCKLVVNINILLILCIFIPAYLTSTQEKYGRLLGGALESTRRYLFETHFTFQQQKILHPKHSKLLNIVARWSKEQETGSARAAIITYTFPEKTNQEIIETLSGLQGVESTLYKSATEVNTVEEEGKLSVYVVNGLAITEDFPWSIFDFVLDYDLNGTMEREVLSCSSQLRGHISLKTIARALLDRPVETKGKYKLVEVCKKEKYSVVTTSEHENEFRKLECLDFDFALGLSSSNLLVSPSGYVNVKTPLTIFLIKLS